MTSSSPRGASSRGPRAAAAPRPRGRSDARGPVALLDPRAPLVLDVSALGRRPGTAQHLRRTVPAPADLGAGVAVVREGDSVELDLRLEAVGEGVLVTGTATAPLSGDCARCLEAVDDELVVDLQDLFVHDDGRTAAVADAAEAAGDAVAGEELRLQGDLLDLEPALRDAVVLALPLAPVCRPDCPGLCAECGARLADEPGHAHRSVDARWAALSALASAPVPARPEES